MGILINDGVEYTDKPKLDKTLSIEGQAADSKAVGDTKISHADVVDNCESTATNVPLSANQGRKIYDKFKKKYAAVGVVPGYGNVVSTNIIKIINNTIYVDAFINITQEIPANGSVVGFDNGEQEIVFNKRHDIILIGVLFGTNNEPITTNRMLAVMTGSNYFIANGSSIPVGLYQLKATIDLD